MRREHLAFAVTVGLFSLGSLVVACGDDDDDLKPVKHNTGGSSGASGAAGSGGNAGGSAGSAGSAGGSTCGAESTATPTTASEFVAQYAVAYCTAGVTCCTGKTSADLCTCESALVGQLTLQLNSLTYDTTEGPKCLSALRALSGAAACTPLTNGIDSCQKALTQKTATPAGKQPGEVCATSDECATPTQGTKRCQEVGVDPNVKKICQNVLPGATGTTPCVGDTRQDFSVNEDPKLAVGTVYRCSAGLVCDGSTRVCGAGVPSGGACSFSEECGGNGFCKDSKCAPPLADGATCTGDADCSPTSFCTSKKVCAPLLADGATCTSSDVDSRCLSGACFDGKCSASGGSSSNLYCAF